jgi:branched-chain amino acid transport system ATP-binding protein
MTGPVLELKNVNKSFGALQVTRDVSLSLMAGARHALIGPNGAGKTTLVHQITGHLMPSSGTILLGDADITHAPPERRVKLGMARTFQINSLFNRLTLAENVGLALGARHGLDARLWGRLVEQDDVVEEGAALLADLGLLPLADRRISDLAYGQRRFVELALALALRPKVLLLDEPLAGVPSSESGMLFELLNRLPEDVAVLIIEHDMDLVFRFAKRITVLVEGRMLMEGTVQEVRTDQRVRDVYLGKAHDHG